MFILCFYFIESVALNFAITTHETSITVENRIDVHVNDSCPDTWYHVQFFHDKEHTLLDNSTNFPKTFEGLEPFTKFKIVITSEKSNIVDKIVQTLEGGNIL